jgi:hypothetical protein
MRLSVCCPTSSMICNWSSTSLAIGHLASDGRLLRTVASESSSAAARIRRHYTMDTGTVKLASRMVYASQTICVPARTALEAIYRPVKELLREMFEHIRCVLPRRRINQVSVTQSMTAGTVLFVRIAHSKNLYHIYWSPWFSLASRSQASESIWTWKPEG